MKYVTGLVVGKFCPLHMGHVALIEQARKQCERVIILSYTSKHFPGCEGSERLRWLRETFPYSSVTARVLDWDCPDDEADEAVHRKFCGHYLLNHLETTVDAVFTSEDYGDGFAEYLSTYFSATLGINKKVEHVLFDKERLIHATSGTAERAAIADGTISNFLPFKVRADFVPRILLLGGESTGKTTLARALATELDCNWVPEFGRTLYDERGGDLRYEDMTYIARTQVEYERRYTAGVNMIICDTSPLTTLFYSQVMFKTASYELRELANRKYTKVYLCTPDIDFEQDGTRRDSEFRMQGHQWYIEQLTLRYIPYKMVGGSLEERVKFIKDDINSSLQG